MTDDASKGPEPFSRGYRGWFLFLMVAVSALSVIDRISVLTVGQAIKRDLILSDMQFGLVSGLGFALFYAILGLPLARLADTWNRARLVAIATAVFSAFSFLTGFVGSFLQLMLCRVIVGVGEAGVQPPTISVISDLYPPRRRGTALSILSIGIPLGSLVGAVAAGRLADLYSWRAVFWAIGLPGVILGAIAWFTLREPPRGLSEARADVGDAPGALAVFRHLAGKGCFWHVVMAMALTNFAAAGVGSFLPQYFTRQFNLSLAATGLMFGIISSLSTLAGTFSGGVIADFITRRDERWYVWLPALGCVVATPLYVASFILPQPLVALVVLTLAGAALFLYYTPVQALLQNLVEPRMRGVAAYIFFLVSALVGFGLGPALLGQLSDKVAAHVFGSVHYLSLCPGGAAPAGSGPAAAKACHDASAWGIRIAMSVMSCLYVWAAVHFALAAKSVRRDLEKGPAA